MRRSEVTNWLVSSKVHPGDVLLIHGDLIVAAQFDNQKSKNIDKFFEVIIEYLGENGTLVVPAFSYSFTKNQNFDVLNTKSSVGGFSEHFRNMKGVQRSHQPIFSMCSIGRHTNLILSADISDCFGKDSAFGLLHKLNAKLMNLACPFEQTFIHYVEQSHSVDYRYPKVFKGKIISHGFEYSAETSYFVGDRRVNYKMDTRLLKEKLIENNELKISSLGRFAAYTVTSENFYDCCIGLLSSDKYSLIWENNEY